MNPIEFIQKISEVTGFFTEYSLGNHTVGIHKNYLTFSCDDVQIIYNIPKMEWCFYNYKAGLYGVSDTLEDAIEKLCVQKMEI